MNKDKLKKHHFWILLGIVPLMVLIAVITISSGVGAAIDAEQAKIKKAQDDIKTKANPKTKDLLAKLDLQVKELSEKRTVLWQQNFEREIGFRNGKQNPAENLFKWPAGSALLSRFNYGQDYQTNKDALKFGAPIPDPDGETSAEFKKREVYLAEYTNPANPARPGMIDRIAPTQFAGGEWDRILRHVAFPPTGPNGWGTGRPSSDQLWLAMEDIWVQRAMLDAVRAVNDQIGAFAKIPLLDEKNQPLPEAPLERAFQSRNWRLTLKAAPRDSDKRMVLSGTLTNMTDRLQLLGVGNTMTLRVWLSNDPVARPFEFKIGGEFVAGRAMLKIVTTADHVIPVEMSVVEIARVEQVFDTRTVPIRRIDRLVMGYADSRNAAVPLKNPLFIKEKEATPGGGGGAPSGPDGSGPPSGMGPGSAGVGSGGRPGGAGGGAGGQAEGGGEASAVLDRNAKRYLGDPTGQIRRMPVAIVLVADQAYLQDILLAYANSPLRFQITQVHWQRFRGTIAGDSGSSGSAAPGGNDIYRSGGGTFGGGFERDDGPRPGRGPGGMGPGGIGPMGPGGVGPMGPGGVGPMGPGGGFFGGGGNQPTVSDAQLTSGLIEVTVYGTVSLYEKYQGEAPPEGAPKQ